MKMVYAKINLLVPSLFSICFKFYFRWKTFGECNLLFHVYIQITNTLLNSRFLSCKLSYNKHLCMLFIQIPPNLSLLSVLNNVLKTVWIGQFNQLNRELASSSVCLIPVILLSRLNRIEQVKPVQLQFVQLFFFNLFTFVCVPVQPWLNYLNLESEVSPVRFLKYWF
jgi:hypothetical protein